MGGTLNREGWLTAFAEEMHPIIFSRTGLKATKYLIACGWPSCQATALENRRVGECWIETGIDGVSQIFVSPIIDDPVDVGGVVIHELLHAFLPLEVGHGTPFCSAARKMGLIGPPTETAVGRILEKIVAPVVIKLGPYPHRRIIPDLSE